MKLSHDFLPQSKFLVAASFLTGSIKCKMLFPYYLIYVLEICTEIAMKPFSLIEFSNSHSHASIPNHAHFRLVPVGMLSVLRNLFGARR